MITAKNLKKFLPVISVLSALGLASPALAENDDELSFNGPYLGVEAGIVKTNHPGGLNTKVSGAFYGIVGGFRKQTKGNFVYGIEGGIAKSSLTADAIIMTGAAHFKIRNMYYFEGLIGVAVKKNVLIFISGGYAHATLRETVNGVFLADFKDGVGRFGGGVEVKVSKAVRIRLKMTLNGFDDGVTTFGSGLLFNF